MKCNLNSITVIDNGKVIAEYPELSMELAYYILEQYKRSSAVNIGCHTYTVHSIETDVMSKGFATTVRLVEVSGH